MKARILFLSLLIFQVNNLQCGVESIEHCLECGSGENINSCKTCEEKYFLFLDNVLCLPCDSIHGQIGCDGNCNITKKNNMSFDRRCLGKCKEGYYYDINQCSLCSKGRSNCGKCQYDPPLPHDQNFDSQYFNCTECSSNQYKFSSEGDCNICSLRNCKYCHFEGENQLCDNCKQGYYLKDGECTECKWTLKSEGEICEVCSDDLTKFNEESCYCITHYTEVDSKQCVKCPENCYNCGYDSQTKNLKCLSCDEGFTLNSKGICVSCGENCDFCQLDINGNPICLTCHGSFKLNEDKNCLACDSHCVSCINGKDNTKECTKCEDKYGLYPNKTCIECPRNCKNCFWNEEKNEFGCSICISEAQLGKDDKCVSCKEIDEIGGEVCNKCTYDKTFPLNNGYKCTECSDKKEYATVETEYKCILNSDSSKGNIIGCLKAEYNSTTGKYECIKCHSGYLYVANEKKCIDIKETNLSSSCDEAENIGNREKPIYSCAKCSDRPFIYTLEDANIRSCEIASNELNNCLLASKTNEGETICTKCKYGLQIYFNSTLNKKMCPLSCENGSFLLYKSCHKCDDYLYGNPGCVPERGCEYNTGKKQLNCNECKEGYFQSSQSCYPCSKKNPGCKKCSISDNNFKCEECFDGFILNNNSFCELIKCKEYPEITPGCIICDDKLEEYKPKSKCQSCKEGFFKTKDESCVFCKAEILGGHGCEQCTYVGDDSESIKCSYCPKGSVLDRYGKCLSCKEQLGMGCSDCMYIPDKEDNYRDKLVCTKCISNYFLTSRGYCIYPKNYYEYIPNCLTINARITTNYKDRYNSEPPYYDYQINPEKFEISSSDCRECDEGFYNNNKNCIELNFENCTFLSIFSGNLGSRDCNNFCTQTNKNVMINYYIDHPEEKTDIKTNDSISFLNKSGDANLYKLLRNNLNATVFHSFNKNHYMCLSNSGIGDQYSPVSLKKCEKAEYNKMANKYECTQCINGFVLDEEAKTCVQKAKMIMKIHPGLECHIENIGTNSEPIYSCKECYSSNDRLVKTESGAKFCLNEFDLLNCTGEIKVDTIYVENKYNCTNCSNNYMPYYSHYYQREICQNIFDKIERTYNFNISYFIEGKDRVKAKNGVCENKKLFTPDGINCFECNSLMPGCKGDCTFSINRSNPLECEGGKCKTGYIEESKGICTKCNIVNEGCIDCHYEDWYPSDYKGLKRKRRFICDQCEEGYIVSADTTCHSCKELGLNDCEKCKWDENKDNDLVCYQCDKGYFLNDDGECIKCSDKQVRVNGNKCVSCERREYGGIEGCSICRSDNNTITECEMCMKGYIFLENNKTCVRIVDYPKFENYPNCARLAPYSGEFQCTLCEVESYSLLKEENGFTCASLEIIPTHNVSTNQYCEKFVNLGSKDKPKFSCHKCIDNIFLGELTKFSFADTNSTYFCDLTENYYPLLGYCSEAYVYAEEDPVRYSCKECYEGYFLTYNKKSNYLYCTSESKCNVELCKTCLKDNNYFCETCVQADYEPNSITGSCVKKTEKVPSITWVDTFGLKMDQELMINGKFLYGPSLKLIGLTNNQINEGHAFSFNLSIEVSDSKEVKQIPMVCVIEEGVDESRDDPNKVEYNCIGNMTSEESSKLTITGSDVIKMEEDFIKNAGKLMPGNLNDINFSTIKEEKPQFSLENLLKTSTFILNEIKDQTSKNLKFDFTLKGKLNGNYNKASVDIDIPFVEIDEKAKCNLKIEKGEENKKADLSCNINLEEYKDYDIFSFKSVYHEDEEGKIVLSDINKIHLINENEGTEAIEDGKKDNKMLYIIIASAGGAAAIGIATTAILCAKKKKARDTIQMNDDNIQHYRRNQQYTQNQSKTNQEKIENKIIKKPGNKPIKKPNKTISNLKKDNKAKKSFKKKDNNLIIDANDSSKRKIIPFFNNN